MEIFKNTNFDFLGKKWPFIIASLVLTVAGLGSLIVKGGPRYGIDFRGGLEATVKFQKRPSAEAVRAAIAKRVPGESSVVEVANSQEMLISVEQQKDEQAQEQVRGLVVQALKESFGSGVGEKLDFNNSGVDALQDRLRIPLQEAGAGLGETELRDLVRRLADYRNSSPRSGLIASLDELSAVSGVTPKVMEVFKAQLGLSPYVIRNFSVVGPKIGAELQNRALQATLYALGGMLLYVAFRFEWIYGLAAVVAVFHDTIITVGLFSIFNKDLSLTVVAAILTLIGYSMNDTIVVFDRIRENLKLNKREPYEVTVNNSINQTLSRTIMVSGLTLLTALALLFFGGEVLNGFSFALVVGIIVGTYSSIFIASPLLIFWRNFVASRKPATATASAKTR